MYQRILVPLDGSDTSTLGLREAIRLAIDQRARLRLVVVVDESVASQNFEAIFLTGDLIGALRQAGKKVIQEALALTRKHGIKADTSLSETKGGRVSDLIVREAKKWKADLIVMGTHGRRGINRMVLGSDAEAVLRTSPVPVLMIRSTDKKLRIRKRTEAP
jgi:nucleotide-binding universal stress UspA family protein